MKNIDGFKVITTLAVAIFIAMVIFVIFAPIITGAEAESAEVNVTEEFMQAKSRSNATPGHSRNPHSPATPTDISGFGSDTPEPTKPISPTKTPWPTYELITPQPQPTEPMFREETAITPAPNRTGILENLLISDQVHNMPIPAGESRVITIKYICDLQNGATIELIPEFAISWQNDPGSFIHCEDERTAIKLKNGDSHEFQFEICPPTTACGEYTFVYTVKVTPNDLRTITVYTVTFKVTII